MLKYISEWYNSQQEAAENAEKALARREKAVRILKQRGLAKLDILGNCRIEDGVIYQDCARLTEKALHEAESFQRKQKIVDDYTELIRELWKYGMGDTIYNFTVNTGYASEGCMIQLDTGELIFSKRRIKKEVQNQKWLEKWSYTEKLTGEIKEYFREKMADEITVEALDLLWNTNIE